MDEELLPIVEKLQDQLTSVQAFIVMMDENILPESSIKSLYAYEQAIGKC